MGKCIIIFKVLLVMLLALAPQVVSAQTSEPYDVVAPTKISGRQKAYTLSFPASAENAPFKLIIKNGTGTPIDKQICKSGLIARLICKLQNAIADIQILKERVAAAQITLNGQKIITPKDLNLTVASIEKDVTLLASNKIEIKTSGFFTSSITYQIQGQKVTKPEILTILSPSDLTTVDGESVLFEGVVNSQEPNLRVVVESLNQEIPITTDNKFNYLFDSLETGVNNFTFLLYSGSTLIDTKEMTILSVDSSGNGSLVTSDGGIIKIENNDELNGASLNIPEGALANPAYIVLQSGNEWVNELPFEKVALGASLSITPYYQYFLKDALLTLPYSQENLPDGVNINDIKVYAYDGKNWDVISPESIQSNSVLIKTQFLRYYAFQVGIEKPLLTGDLMVQSNVFGASIYIDDVYEGDLTPAVIKNIADGTHTIKVYSDGYNEVIKTFTFPEENRIDVNLSSQIPNNEPEPFETSVQNNSTTYDRTADISGVLVSGEKVNDGFAVASVNSIDYIQKISKTGKFLFKIPLKRGTNTIAVRTTINGKTSKNKTVNINRKDRELVKVIPDSMQSNNLSVAAVTTSKVGLPTTQELKVEITWDSPQPNGYLMMQESDPDNYYTIVAEASLYGDPNGIPGASISQNNFFFPNARDTTYTANAVNYGVEPASGVINMYIDNLLIRTTRFNVGGRYIQGHVAYPGIYPLGFDVKDFTFEVTTKPVSFINEPLPKFCVNIREKSSGCLNYMFTTQIPENNIYFKVTATQGLINQVKFKVKEITQGSDVSANITTGILGRYMEGTFDVINKPLLINRHIKSRPLTYEITPYTDLIQYRPYYIVQSIQSQIYQEYYDKAAYEPSFVLLPNVGDINNHYISYGPYMYSFEEMTKISDFPGYGMVNDSKNYAAAVFLAYRSKYPNIPLTLTSAWRNPIRNYEVKATINSQHQKGDAVDFVVPYTSDIRSEDYVEESDRKLMELCQIAKSALGSYNTYVLYHLAHVHIQRYTGQYHSAECSSKKQEIRDYAIKKLKEQQGNK